DYENEQGHSPVFSGHIDRMMERVILALDGGPETILEVGCGQGEFLRRLEARVPGEQIRLIGVDPTFRSSPIAGGRVSFLASTLEDLPPGALPSEPSILLSRHV